MRCYHLGMTHLQPLVSGFRHTLECMNIAHPREGDE